MKTIRLEGRIDANNAAALEPEILASVSPGMDIELDASELDYISSAGLRLLMKLRKQVNKFLQTSKYLQIKAPALNRGLFYGLKCCTPL